MSSTDNQTTNSGPFQCDEPGCDQGADIFVGDARACFNHARQRGNAIRKSRGFLPLIYDEEGRSHVEH